MLVDPEAHRCCGEVAPVAVGAVVEADVVTGHRCLGGGGR